VPGPSVAEKKNLICVTYMRDRWRDSGSFDKKPSLLPSLSSDFDRDWVCRRLLA